MYQDPYGRQSRLDRTMSLKCVRAFLGTTTLSCLIERAYNTALKRTHRWAAFRLVLDTFAQRWAA